MKNVANNLDFVSGLVSIIVPIYNSREYLHRCMKSIINQSYKNIEIILINDGSTDNSGKICDGYALKDKRVKVIHKKNEGPAIARNAGINNSRGEFIFFADSDDSVENDSLDLLINTYKKHKVDIILGDFIIKSDNSNPAEIKFLLPNSKLLGKQDIVDYALDYLKKPAGYSFFNHVWGKLFKSSIIKNNNIQFNTKLQVFEDILFNFEYLKFTKSAYYIRNHIYIYITSNSATSAGMKIIDNPVGYKLALISIQEFLQTSGIDENIIKKEIGNACVSFTIRTMIRFFTLNMSQEKIYKTISIMINDSDIRQNLKYYSPSKGDSRILPLLIKLKLILPITWVCKYKVYKRGVAVK